MGETIQTVFDDHVNLHKIRSLDSSQAIPLSSVGKEFFLHVFKTVFSASQFLSLYSEFRLCFAGIRKARALYNVNCNEVHLQTLFIRLSKILKTSLKFRATSIHYMFLRFVNLKTS